MQRLIEPLQAATREGMRRARELRWDRVRRRAAPFVVALALLAPMGGLLTSRVDLARESGPESGEAAAERATAATEAERRRAARDSSEADPTEPTVAAPSDAEVGRAWAAAVLAREEDAAAAAFAKRFGIGVGLAKEIHAAAREEEIDPKIAFGLVRTESSFRRTVVSYAGAVGYTQLLPSTARWIAPGTGRGDLFDTRTNLRVGFRYLRYLMDKYDDDTRLALLAYNRGPGTVDGILRRGGNPDNGYADKVLRG